MISRLLILFIIAFALFLVKRMAEGGAFYQPQDFNVQHCRSIATVPGCEDIQVDPSQDLLYLSVTNWTLIFKGKLEGKGGIFALDLKNKDAKPQHVSMNQPDDFTPHGIHLYEDPQTGERSLFVVNHRKDGNSIEIFDVIDRKTGTLKHRETLTHELLNSPNEIYATGKRSFYVSQDTQYPLNSWYLPLIAVFGMEEGKVVYYDGSNWKTVAEHIHFANGITMSSDKKTLYLGETCNRGVRAYERDLKTNDLTFKAYYDLGAGPDNINMDSEGNIWIAGIPNLEIFTRHEQNGSIKTPVEILKARFEGDKLVEVKKMLSSTGEAVSGITGASYYDGKVIMVGPLQTEVVMCDLREDGTQVETMRTVEL